MSKAKTIKGGAADGLARNRANSHPPEAAVSVIQSGAALPPRTGTKQALIVTLLSRPEGASLVDLSAATEWLPHTTRAALTGLRQRGFSIERQFAAEGPSVYRIPATALDV